MLHHAFGASHAGCTMHPEQPMSGSPCLWSSPGGVYLAFGAVQGIRSSTGGAYTASIAQMQGKHAWAALSTRLAGFTMHLEQARRGSPCSWSGLGRIYFAFGSRPSWVYLAFAADHAGPTSHLEQQRWQGKPRPCCSKCMVNLACAAPNAR